MSAYISGRADVVASPTKSFAARQKKKKTAARWGRGGRTTPWVEDGGQRGVSDLTGLTDAIRRLQSISNSHCVYMALEKLELLP